ncbi:MAG: dynamin family protein [Myxococcota bacterium]
MSEIQDQACNFYKQLEPLAKRYLFENPPPSSEVNGMPIVLLLGNHSSGKSSFINHLLGSKAQRTGIAPIDDGFTILMYGDESGDRDGAAVVTNPDLGWEELKNFGDMLVGRLRLRTHQSEALRNIALIDSPGMIDAANSSSDRGYDFAEVVRWFAQRADVILFLFDPDKPGTTGETVQVLKDSLDGLDHKVLLVFNKVDRFESMRDFARAYGALCWNLARAYSPRKDLPHIYNTYLPIDEENQRNAAALPLEDFDKAREEVLSEVRRAPLRRLDNVVSRLYRYTRRLKMHAQIISQRELDHRRRQFYYFAIGIGLTVLGGLAAYGVIALMTESVVASVFGIVGVVTLGIALLIWLFSWNKKPLKPQALFEEAFEKELTLKEKAADLRVLWDSVAGSVNLAFDTGDRFRRISRSDLKRLDKIISVEVPNMRSEAEELRRSEVEGFE